MQSESEMAQDVKKGRPAKAEIEALRRLGIEDAESETGVRMLEVGERAKIDKKDAQKLIDAGAAKAIL